MVETMAPEGKLEPKVVLIEKETIPLLTLKRLKRYPPKKPNRSSENVLQRHPHLQEVLPKLPKIDRIVEMQQEMLRQYENKGYAEEEAILPEVEATA
jgi:hypothetical protein